MIITWIYLYLLCANTWNILKESLFTFTLISSTNFSPYLSVSISGHFMPGAVWQTAGYFTGTDTHRLNTSKHLTTRLANRRNCPLQLSLMVKMGQPSISKMCLLAIFSKKRPMQFIAWWNYFKHWDRREGSRLPLSRGKDQVGKNTSEEGPDRKDWPGRTPGQSRVDDPPTQPR